MEDQWPNEDVIVPSLEELFRCYYPRLCHFAFQILGDKSHSEDIVQECFIRYWHLRAEISSHPGAIRNFLYSSIRNASLNYLRRQKVEEKYILSQDPDPSEDARFLHAIIRSEVMDEIYRVIDTLPDGCQKVFKLGYLEGLKNPKIAEKLGVSINTVKTQKKRGLQLLRLKLNPEVFLVFALFVFK
ncbi:RNA polymerase sigma-70 factor (ECF subfamily) [Arcticibacter tournemirensis]|uniref:RNA polymerase sigma-70 factor n=1 Tax=Arcticibacter tournemirensis TaxID=699437 RepID=A0A4Q0M5T6_9SPHI|nr:RNA polymerase sigma-70 factor [Arcticibacter tournemirensis]KAA8480164.1 RNA polymerase sigma-70 factor [Arcticibacter tournemirensis]RXF68324.1 RNA polymerase sigma-70 factor [Arcticibacter tournemirensis]TQM52644.1 RNA polymerase sigma-70 factor (ECF subfamily) [Arcticibacter tournemirensis]